MWAFWRYCEGKEGNFEWDAVNAGESFSDVNTQVIYLALGDHDHCSQTVLLCLAPSDIAMARAQGFRVTLTLASRAPEWARWAANPSGLWPDPALASTRLKHFCSSAVARYAVDIDSVELDNEPDGMYVFPSQHFHHFHHLLLLFLPFFFFIIIFFFFFVIIVTTRIILKALSLSIALATHTRFHDYHHSTTDCKHTLRYWDLHIPLSVAAAEYSAIVAGCGGGVSGQPPFSLRTATTLQRYNPLFTLLFK